MPSDALSSSTWHPESMRLGKCASCFITRVLRDWEPCKHLNCSPAAPKLRFQGRMINSGWTAGTLRAWGNAQNHLQVVAIRKPKNMTPQGQSPNEVIMPRHLLLALHLPPATHQEAKHHKLLRNYHTTMLGTSQELQE